MSFSFDLKQTRGRFYTHLTKPRGRLQIKL